MTSVLLFTPCTDLWILMEVRTESNMHNLWNRFAKHYEQDPQRTALVFPDTTHTYLEVGNAARRISAMIRAQAQDGPFIGLMTQRSFGSYAGMLGILHAGRAYVPLSPDLPTERLVTIATSGRVGAIVTDPQREDLALALAAVLPHHPPVLVVPETEEWTPLTMAPLEALTGDLAYMLFTSGSTGTPKGVPIRHRNVVAYLDAAMALIKPVPEDRFSQLFELTFDLSVHDIFLCWTAGATLCVPAKEELLAPAHYVRRNSITCWFSVPSVAMMLDRMRLLKPGAFPTIRSAAFCGEPLATAIARRFASAAPSAEILNLYGPTEATIAITAYVLPSEEAKEHPGVLSIGRPFPSATIAIQDEQGGEASEGELLLGGPQVTDAYWEAPAITAKAFINRGPQAFTFYRTGDRVIRDAEGDLLFLGRIDHQVKVRGHRIELEEINHVLRQVSGASFAYSVAHPMRDGIATGIVSFLPAALRGSAEDILKACGRKLPEHMLPGRLVFTDDIPFNTSGKADLRAMVGRLEAATY